MKKILKNAIGIVLALLFCVGKVSIGATVTNIEMSEVIESGSGEDREWEATNYYIKKIEVLRMSKGEAFTLNVSKGPLLGGRRKNLPENEESIRFENVITASNGGIDVSYRGSLTVNDYSNDTYEVETSQAQGNRLIMDLKAIEGEENSDKPTMRGSQTISVASAVPDGVYDLVYTTRIGNTSKAQLGTMEIKTLPTVRIEDIDFGNYPVGAGRINVERSSPIFITGGTPNEKFKLILEGVSEEASNPSNRIEISLTNPNTDQSIEVTLSIVGANGKPKLDSSGENTEASVKATINSVSPTIGGTYSGRAKVIFEYN